MPNSEPVGNNHQKSDEKPNPEQNLESKNAPPFSGKEKLRSRRTVNPENGKAKPRIINIDKFPKLDIVENVEANQIAKRANRISFWSSLVNILLFIVTLFVFNETRKATEATIKAATAAKLSADLQKETLDSQKSAKKQSDIAEGKKLGRDTDFINKQKKGIDYQIAALKETQDDFEKNNSPYLQVRLIDFSPVAIGMPIDLSIKYQNLGNYPAKVISSVIAATTRVYPPNVKDLENSKFVTLDNYYIPSRDTSQTLPFPSIIKKIDKEQYKAISENHFYIYVTGIVKYQNLSNKKFKTYKYTLKVQGFGNGWQYIVNDNEDLN